MIVKMEKSNGEWTGRFANFSKLAIRRSGDEVFFGQVLRVIFRYEFTIGPYVDTL